MKTHQYQIDNSKTAIIVEFNEEEQNQLEKGEIVSVKITANFHNAKLINEEMERFWEQVEEEHNKEEYNRLTKELEELKEKLKL